MKFLDCFIILIYMITFGNTDLVAQTQSQISDRKIYGTQTLIFDSRKEIQNKIITTNFDKHGNIVLLIERDIDSNVLKWESSIFDQRQNEIVHIFYDKEGQINKKIQYQYNNLNQLICTLTTDKSDQLIEKQIVEYDKFGNKIKECTLNNKDIQESCIVYEYDKKDMLIGKVITDGMGKVIYSKKISYQY